MQSEIKTLKELAKKYARANRIPQHEALNVIASELGFTGWTQLVKMVKKGWLPSAEQIATADAAINNNNPCAGKDESNIERSFSRPTDEPIRQGKVGNYAYQVFEFSGDLRMEGEGWRVLIGEADYSQPVVEIEATHENACPVQERGFLDKALAIADEEMTKVRAGIASDWPRRSTKPDADGAVVHPLFGDQSAEWFCLHCNGKVTGAQLAENLWHCTGCGATPIDIFSSPFWLEANNEEPKPIGSSKNKKRPEARIKVVDSRPKLMLDQKAISLLLRTALLEDAKTPGERIGAIQAEIHVDENGDADIIFDEDLWPEDKDPEEAYAVAEKLGIHLELSVTCMTFPFAWPGLGHATTSTREYVQMLLNAYEEHGVVHRGKKND